MENPEMKNIWIGDSGASWHYVSSDQGMYDCKPCDDKITIANGNTIQVEKQGRIRVEYQMQEGTKLQVVLENMKYSPKLKTNLFSINQVLRKGWQLGNEEKTIKIEKGKTVLKFNKHIGMSTGTVPAIELIPVIGGVGSLSIINKPEISFMDFHRILGHMNNQVVQDTAKHYKVKITGKEEQCKDCLLTKTIIKNLNHQVLPRSQIKGEHFLLI